MYATADLGTSKNQSRGGDFGFPAFTTSDIPNGATINSVTVTVEWGMTVATTGSTLGVQLRNGATALGTETTKTTATEGQNTQVVTSGIALADLRSAGTVLARVRYAKGNTTTGTIGNLDFVTLTVDYSPPPSIGQVVETDTAQPITVVQPVSDPRGQAIQADAPFAWWRFNEPSGASVVDDFVGANDGTPSGGVALGATGGQGNAATFDGVDDKVVTTTLGAFGGSLISSSWEFWIKTSSTAFGAVLGTINTSTTSAIVGIYLNSLAEALSAGKTEFHMRDADGVTRRGTISTNIYDDQWHHVVWVVNADGTFTVYVDGTSQTVTYTISSFVSTGVNFDWPLAFGCRNNRGTYERFGAFTIDDLAIYAVRLTSTQVSAHYSAGASGMTATPGQVTETGSAQQIARQKVRTIGQATDTATAQPVTRGTVPKVVAVGQASESDTAQALTKRKAKATGQITEADTAQVLTRRKARTPGQATESSTAQTVTRRKVRAVGQVTETGTAQPVTRVDPILRAVGQASELDTAQPVARRKSRAAGQSTETGTTQALSRHKVRTSGQAAESSSAQPFGRRKARTLGQASDASTAQPVTRFDPGQTITPVGQASDASTAQPITRQKVKPVSQASEADTAQTSARRKSRALGQGSEADTAQPVGRRAIKSVGQASDAGTAQAITRRKVHAVGQASEADATQAVARYQPGQTIVPVGQASDSESAQAVTKREVEAVGQASDASSAQPVSRAHRRTTGQPTESGTAQPVRRFKIRVVEQASDASSAQPVTRRKARTVGTPAEASSGSVVASAKVRVVGQASEVDSAQSVRHVTFAYVLVGQASESAEAQPVTVTVIFAGTDVNHLKSEERSITTRESRRTVAAREGSSLAVREARSPRYQEG